MAHGALDGINILWAENFFLEMGNLLGFLDGPNECLSLHRFSICCEPACLLDCFIPCLKYRLLSC